MARDIEVDLHVNDDTAAGLNSAAARLEAHEKKIREDGDRTSKAYSDRLLKSVAKVSPEIANRLEKAFGKQSLKLKDDTEEGFKSATERLRVFEQEFDKGGGKAGKGFADAFVKEIEYVSTGISKEVKEGLDEAGREAEKQGVSQVKNLQQFGSRFLRVINDISPVVAKGLADAARAAGPPVILALAGILAAAAPVLGGTLAGLISGGGALAGIGGAVILALQRPDILNQAKATGSRIMANLVQDTDKFVEPLQQGLAFVEREMANLRPVFRSIFEGSGRLLEPLLDGVLRFTRGIAEGIDAAVQGAGPVIDGLADGLDVVGQAIKDMFVSFSDNGVEAGLALQLSLKGVAAVINTITNAVEGLTASFGFFAKLGLFGKTIQTEFIRLTLNAEAAKIAAEQSATGIATVGVSADRAAEKVGSYTTGVEQSVKAMSDAAGKASGLFGAITNAGKAYADAKAAIKENGQTLSANTEAGRANRDALQGVADAAVAARDKFAAVGDTSAGAQAQVAGLTARVYATALAMTGSATEAQRLTDELLGIPTSHATKVTTPGAIPSKIAANNLTNAINGIPGAKGTKITANAAQARSEAADFRSQLLNIPSVYNVNVGVHVNDSQLASVERRLARVSGEYSAGAFAGRANDGIVSRTGGARGVKVTSNVAVSLDGRPFREYTAREVGNERDRSDFRNRVGWRNN